MSIGQSMRCRRCGNTYECEGLSQPLCPVCQMEREGEYQMVREIVREFPGITALEVNEHTQVPMEKILRYIDKGLLEVVENKNKDGIPSERIGLMIKKIREKRKIYEKPKKEETPPKKILDEIGDTENEQKFTWLDNKEE